MTVLQHITDREAFAKAAENIARVTKEGGHILILGTSPIKVKKEDLCLLLGMIIKSRNEWIDGFQDEGCKLVCEFGLPQVGISLLQIINRLLKSSLLLRRDDRLKSEVIMDDYRSKPLLSLPYNLVRAIILKLSKPSDYFLMPFPNK